MAAFENVFIFCFFNKTKFRGGLFVCLVGCLFVYLFACLFICLFVCLFVCSFFVSIFIGFSLFRKILGIFDSVLCFPYPSKAPSVASLGRRSVVSAQWGDTWGLARSR